MAQLVSIDADIVKQLQCQDGTVISIEERVNQLKMKHGTVILIDLDTIKQLKCQHGTVFH